MCVCLEPVGQLRQVGIPPGEDRVWHLGLEVPWAWRLQRFAQEADSEECWVEGQVGSSAEFGSGLSGHLELQG